MRNKLYWGLGVLIILIIATGGFVFYQQWTEIQQLKDAAEADNPLEEPIAQSDEPIVSSDKPITKDDLPAADEGFKWVQHGDHFHQVQIDAPDEWQGEQHEPVVPPNKSDIHNKSDYIYDLQREKSDGWDPHLVYEIGDKKIDLNFRPLTVEEQAEYERLKATENLEAYGRNVEAELRFVAIINIQTDLMQRIQSNISNNPKEVEKLSAEYDKLYGRFPVSD